MRCPNCGNENPEDYTFCDECGAKLGSTSDSAGSENAEMAPVGAVSEPISGVMSGPAGAGMSGPISGPGTMSGPMGMGEDGAELSPGGPVPDLNGMDMGDPSGAGPVGAPAGGLDQSGTGTCPNCGAVTVPGEAFCNECGVELATAATAAPATAMSEVGAGVDAGPEAGFSDAIQPPPDAGPTMEPYGAEMGGNMPAVEPAPPPEISYVDTSQEVPVTDDTMVGSEPLPPGGAGVYGAVPPMEEQQPALPGVMPMPTESAPAAQEVPQMAAMPSAAQAGVGMEASTWATEALRQLEEAQAATARGDWIAYGQMMGTLKSFLESIAQGAAPAMGGVGMAGVAGMGMMAAAAAQPASMPDVSQAPVMDPTMAAGMAAGQTPYSTGSNARLVLISTGAEMPLPQQEEITVGREDPSSGIFPDIDLTPYGGEDGGVSRRHARMLHIGGDYFIEDLQSTNYTKLDGQRLPARVREKLEDGARVDFGRVAVIFRKG